MSARGAAAVESDAKRLELLRPVLVISAAKTGLDVAMLAAIASRETGADPRYCLAPSAGGLLGDSGHGHGPLQVDDRFHPAICLRWRAGQCALQEIVDYSAQILLESFRAFRRARARGMSDKDQIRCGIAAYNAGVGRVGMSWLMGDSVDQSTTGQDYSSDVLTRMSWLQIHGW
jgi:hypothetical protein